MAFTGNQATISFSDSGWTAKIKMIGGNEESIPVLDADGLDDDIWKPKHVGDLVDPGEMEIEFYTNPNNPPPRPGQYKNEDVVLTFPPPPGEVNGSTQSFVGTITKRRLFDKLQNNELAMGTVTVTLNGGSTFSDAPSGTYA